MSLASSNWQAGSLSLTSPVKPVNIIQESKSCQGGDSPSGLREFYKRQKFGFLFCLMGHRIDF